MQKKTYTRFRIPLELRAAIADLELSEAKKYAQLLEELIVLGNDVYERTSEKILPLTLDNDNSISVENFKLPTDFHIKLKNKKYVDRIVLKDRLPALVKKGYELYTGKILIHKDNNAAA